METQQTIAVIALMLASFATGVQLTNIEAGKNIEKNSILLCLNAVTFIACSMRLWLY